MIRAGVAALALLALGGDGRTSASEQSPAGASTRLDEASQNRPHEITQSGRGAYEASLAAASGGFAVAWYDTRDGHPEIYSRLLDKRGEPTGPERRMTTGVDRAYEAEIATIGDNLAVAWYEVAANRTSHAMLGLWSRDGHRLWARALALPERISKNPVVRADAERDLLRVAGRKRGERLRSVSPRGSIRRATPSSRRNALAPRDRPPGM